MSRAYRVSWQRASAVVTAEDRLCMELDLLPILPEGEMEALLREALEEAGWRGEGRDLVTELRGAELRLEQGTITATLSETQRVEGRGTSKATAKAQAEARKETTQARMAADVTATLAGLEADIRGALEAVVQRTYVRALERKAARMGEVVSVVESTAEDGTTETTIRVKV